MKNGAIYTMVFIVNWDKLLPQILYSNPYEDNIIVNIGVEPVCCMKIEILDGERSIGTFVSQRLSFNGNGAVFLGVSWDEEEIKLQINMKDVKNHKCADIMNVSVIKENIIESDVYKDDNIYEICADWIKWRIERYSSPHIKSNRIAKTVEEQFVELSNNIKSLSEIYDATFNQHKEYLLPNLYTSLRSLLFWADDPRNRSYNPLLLRLAAFLQLPLPVYAVPNSPKKFEEAPPVIKEVLLILKNPMAFTHIRQQGQCIMDIQEWLNSRIYIDPNNNSEYKLRELIRDSANIWGAHSDEGIPVVLDYMRKTKIISDEVILIILKNAVEVTIDSGMFVLKNYPNNSSHN